jgi:hypothetical protein
VAGVYSYIKSSLMGRIMVGQAGAPRKVPRTWHGFVLLKGGELKEIKRKWEDVLGKTVSIDAQYGTN